MSIVRPVTLRDGVHGTVPLEVDMDATLKHGIDILNMPKKRAKNGSIAMD